MSDADDNQIAANLAEYSTSMLSDATGGAGVVAPGLNRYAGMGTITGRAITADCAEGSLQAVFAALEYAQPGNMLCAFGPGNSAYLGDILANNLQRHGLVGAVIDGFIRDRAAIANMSMNFHARGLFPLNQRRQEPGSAMGPITIGGIVISAGDWIVADDDGIIVIPPKEVPAILERARTATAVERRVKELLRQGIKVNDAVKQAWSEIRALDRDDSR